MLIIDKTPPDDESSGSVAEAAWGDWTRCVNVRVTTETVVTRLKPD